MALNIFGSSV